MQFRSFINTKGDHKGRYPVTVWTVWSVWQYIPLEDVGSCKVNHREQQTVQHNPLDRKGHYL